VKLLKALPSGFPGAILITQHITPDFTIGLAEWLTQQSRFPVRVASPGDRPTAGLGLLAGRDDHLVLRADGTLGYTPYPTDTPFRPNVDALFDSVAAHWPTAGCGVLLTGMGRDGAEGLLMLRRAGWHTFAQDGPSCVVNGMPDAAVKLGAAQHVLTPAEISKRLATMVGPR
jgi:chemotaxis response regulator CheB